MSFANEGQRLLVATNETQKSIGKAADVESATAGRWKRGESLPRRPSRALLYQAFGIPVDAWDKRADGDESDDDDAPSPKLAEVPAPEIPPYPEAPARDAPYLEHIRYQLACTRHDLQHRGLTATALSKLRGDERSIMKDLREAERRAEMNEDRYVREHPAFRAHCERVLTALEPYPEAMQAVVDALA